MGVLALALIVAGTGAIVWLVLRLARLRAVPPPGRPPPPSVPAHASYSEEIAAAVAQLSHLDRDTLLHLRRQGMRTFKADRDSPVLKRLMALNLLSAEGSSALPPDDFPFVIPKEVWSHLGEIIAKGDRRRADPGARPWG